jgi:hypothetical protein
MRALAVIVDGVPMPEAEARAFWGRFSAHLEEKKGDLAGFAQAEGFASVHPETHGGVPTLVASRTAPQKAYGNAPKRAGGSPAPQKRDASSPKQGRNPQKKRG